MIGTTDWTQYLHTIRKREVDAVFSLLPQKKLLSGLEIGAGDGYQTTLLAPHVEKFISSDLNFKRIKDSLKIPGVTYQLVDADSIKGVFPDSSFDFIFSSNVLEHVHDPFVFMGVTQPMLMESGYAIHVVPSRHIKIFYLLFYYPNLAILFFKRLWGKINGESFFKGSHINLANNINTKTGVQDAKTQSRFKKFLFPAPHGNFPGHLEEFKAFGKKQWEYMFIRAGYSVVAYAKGPAFSGYGFGFETGRKILEYFGVSSEHIFILKKMTTFEMAAWKYTNTFLNRGSMYEKQKFVRDWMNKEKNAKAFVADFVKDVGNPRGKKVLDVGFGNGIMLRDFIAIGAIAYGLETEHSLLNMASDQIGRDANGNLRATLSIYDGKSFPFPDNIFSFVYSTSVLEHMSYPAEVISEISRTLVPGGKFYLSFPNKYAPKESHTGLWFISWLPRPFTQFILRLSKSSPLEDWNLHFVSFFDVKKMAKKAGLRIVYDTRSSSGSRFRIMVKKLFACCGIHYGVLLKTLIVVLEKPKD